VKLTPVKSSNIDAVGHDAKGLLVRFKGGAVYRYPELGADMALKLQAAESAGKMFASEIRGRHRHVKVDV
jgi:hypothetical protein